MVFIENLMEKNSDSIPIYTDGPKGEFAIGYAAVNIHTTVAHKLHTNTGIFSEELYATKAAPAIRESAKSFT